MIYERRSPSTGLEKLINCYWLIDSEGDVEVDRQKIVPDGYPEIIIHYADPYRIDLGNGWQKQGNQLLAGQIKKHFYLENTSKSGMVGIKLQPTALTQLFGQDMSLLTDQVVPLSDEMSTEFRSLTVTNAPSTPSIFDQLDQLFIRLAGSKAIEEKAVDKAVQLIIDRKGNVEMTELCDAVACSQRQLERQFKVYVGLSPKFYSRIIRLGHIFELMQQGDQTWSDLVYHSGFYDQSHFIKNFKEFTGEDPSAYGFEEENMANFHLRK